VSNHRPALATRGPGDGPCDDIGDNGDNGGIEEETR
jgi:hypothetical protein